MIAQTYLNKSHFLQASSNSFHEQLVVMQTSYIEVPVGIVGIIAHRLFCAEGLREAWKLRPVCATFASAIKDDMLLYRIKEVLYERRNNGIMSHLMPDYLYYRIIRPCDEADSFLAKV
ncbi:hypothetical protein G6011_09305 [Alternaria panax]|uniref:Uncharacterized protein n=1 Tax=Alternaria panax TaxID=48097 RepID=A0AAD4IAS8_9PLEO|nr:hypothetical protein G6011_09305 [Alternaria panax]